VFLYFLNWSKAFGGGGWFEIHNDHFFPPSMGFSFALSLFLSHLLNMNILFGRRRARPLPITPGRGRI